MPLRLAAALALTLALPAAAGTTSPATPPAPAAVAAPAAPAAPAAAPLAEGAALIFADRPYAEAAGAGLGWRLDRRGGPAEGFLPVEDGRVTLAAVTDPADGKPMLELRETGGGRDRVVGRYAPGMDPLVVYFLETATRNVSALAGGNPDYIRNRIKAALREGGEVTPLADGARRVTLRPLAGDKAAPRMRGFDALSLAFDIPAPAGAPIRRLAAEGPGYAMTLEALP